MLLYLGTIGNKNIKVFFYCFLIQNKFLKTNLNVYSIIIKGSLKKKNHKYQLKKREIICLNFWEAW